MGSSSLSPVKPAYVFLGFPVKGLQKIILIAPNHPELNEVQCDLIVASNVVATRSVKFRDEIVRLYEFSFENLSVGCQYRYQFRTERGLLDVEGGLSQEDLNFIFHDQLGSQSTALLVSCNGVKNFEGKGCGPFDMWERMYEEVQKLPERPYLIINGGDQYYQDSMEEEWLKLLTAQDFERLHDPFKRASLKNALEHMDNPAYRKLMAQIPSIAMLDDHDITDGAGGRPEFFEGEGFKPEYENFQKTQVELFDLLQASRNPTPICRTGGSGFSFVLDLGASALVALDLRTQKNAKTKQLMLPETEDAVFKAIEELPHDNVLVLVPIVPIRNARELEAWLLGSAKVAAAVASGMKPESELGNQVKHALQYFGGLEDDLLDALSSESNIDFMIRFLKTLAKGARRGVNYTLLSGDIHTGGSIETRITVDGFTFKLPIVVSSSIGYQPMNFLVEAVLREKCVIDIEHGGVRIRAIDNFFTSQRNFVLFEPGKLGAAEKDRACRIFQEKVPGSRFLQVDAWVESDSTITEEAKSCRKPDVDLQG